MKSFFLNILTSLITLLILFGLLEIGIRVFVDKNKYKPVLGETTWAVDETIGWTNANNLDLNWLDEIGPMEFKTNGDGLQPYTFKAEKDTSVLRVMIIGNSTVAGLNVRSNEKINSHLDSLLNASGIKAEVINAGVNGYSTDQSLYFLERNIGKYKPDIVTYGFCMNDLFANSSSNAYGYNKPHVKLVGDTLEYIGMLALNNPADRVPSTFSMKNLMQKSVLYGMLRPYIRATRLKFTELDKIDQGGGFDIYKSDEINPDIKVLGLLIQDMYEVCEIHGTDFFFYSHPEVGTVWPPYREAVKLEETDPFIVEKKLEHISTNINVPFVGMVEYFSENNDRGPFHLLPVDPHCNGTGYLLQAEVLSDYILQQIKTEKDTVILN